MTPRRKRYELPRETIERVADELSALSRDRMSHPMVVAMLAPAVAQLRAIGKVLDYSAEALYEVERVDE